MASLPIPNDLIAEIFLRLPTPADLVRASASCASFRAMAAGRSFLRRFRKLHARPLLGFLDTAKVFHPATAPHPSAPAASAVALAADFSFLPAAKIGWFLDDVRDGRVLLSGRVHNSTAFISDMVVCDPLHQKYLLLPPITRTLVDSVDNLLWTNTPRRPGMFLVPAGDEADQETSFRVICMVCDTSLVAFIYSSNTGQWRVISPRLSDLTAGFPSLPKKFCYYSRQYVYGCFYWYWVTPECGGGRRLLVLDTKTMGFSFAELPPEAYGCPDFAMVEAGEGRPGLFVLADSRSDLSYFIRINNGGSSSQWQKVKTISVGSESRFICTMEKHLLLHQEQSSLLEPGCFTLHIETFQLERVCTLDSNCHKLQAYINFPPSLLSSPTISSAKLLSVENKAEKEILGQGCAAGSSAESPRSG